MEYWYFEGSYLFYFCHISILFLLTIIALSETH